MTEAAANTQVNTMHFDRKTGLGHAESRDRYVDNTFSTDCRVGRPLAGQWY